ncbi:MAG: nucleotidyltransferase family protein [Tetrasphaera sp.]|nr:nucleotidyltransferase family protein [Tetrasphaera sp.]
MSQTEKTVPLTLAEATDLAAGLVASSAAESGIDALVVKGRYAAEQGLRPVRTASDVDVLVRVDDCPRIIKVLERKGWSPRPVDPDDAIFPHHSIPLIHPGWPCDIDVHTNFPGCDAHPDAVFDALFARRVPAEAAASPIWIPDATATALIMALHSLRTPRGDPELSDLQFVERAAPALVNGADLVALAEKAGALGALLPFLASVFPRTFPLGVSTFPGVDFAVDRT